MVYFSYFHSIMTYGLAFWGNSHYSNSVFKLQKRIIRIMVGIRDRKSCREYFVKLKILPLQPQYIYTYSYYLWLIIDNNLKDILIYIILVLGMILTCNIHRLICRFTRKVHITLGLRYLTGHLFQQSYCPLTQKTKLNPVAWVCERTIPSAACGRN
jgi:hypothetical protein